MQKILEFFGLIPDYSAYGYEVDQVNNLVHWLMLVLFVGWTIFFFWVLFRYRKGKNPSADYHGLQKNYSTPVEIIVAVVEVVLLLGFSIPIWAKRTQQFPPENESVVVRVVAQQFAWNIHYPGPDGVFGRTDIKLVNEQTNPLGLDLKDPKAKDDVITLNQLHLPVDKNIIIKLRSKDVIHCFSLPVMRVKHDVNPGMEIPVWFKAKKTGKTHIACAQLCGLGHFRMKGYLTIHEQADFDKWMAAKVKESLETEAPDDFWN